MGVEQVLLHVGPLRRYARLLTGDAHRANDLVQDTLERACARFDAWRPGTDLKAWLLTLMHNLHANQRRDRRHDDDALDVDSLPEAGHEPLAALPDRMDLERALARLTPAAREVLLLVTVGEYRYHEVAEILDIPIGTVMSRLHRAREHLRVALTPSDAAATAAADRPPLRIVPR